MPRIGGIAGEPCVVKLIAEGKALAPARPTVVPTTSTVFHAVTNSWMALGFGYVAGDGRALLVSLTVKLFDG